MRSKVINDILNFFNELVCSEKAAYQLKSDMALMGLNSKKLFNRVSKDQEFITIKDMTKYVDGKIACNDRQMYDIFERFDHTRSGVISLGDFKHEIVVVLKKGKYQKRVKRQEQHVVEQRFISLLSTMVRSTRVLDTWRKQLEIFTPYIIFEEINRGKTGVISRRELFQFYYEHGKQLNPSDAQMLYLCLLRRCHKELNLEVFCENLKPLEFGYYKAFKYHFEKDIQDELNFKERILRQSIEHQQNYLRERRNKQIVGMIHQEAALSREEELEKRVKDEIRVYQELKFKAKKKFHPHLTFEEFLIMEKQNEAINMLKIKAVEEGEKLKDAAYREKIFNVEVLRQVQKFQEKKYQPFVAKSLLTDLQGVKRKIPLQELEKRIKSHAFLSRNLDNLLIKRQVEKDLNTFHRVR